MSIDRKVIVNKCRDNVKAEKSTKLKTSLIYIYWKHVHSFSLSVGKQQLQH